jgi:hypothetical protein
MDVGPHTLELWKVSAIDEARCEVTWLTPTPPQVDIDLKTHDQHSLSHLKPENFDGVEKLTSWMPVVTYWSNQPSDFLNVLIRIPTSQ